MSLEEQIKEDYVKAMKARDSVQSSTLNFLRAQLKNVIINERLDKLEDDVVLQVLKKQIKQRQDSIQQFSDAGRMELVEKEKAELEILQGYLPKQLSEEAIGQLVDDAVEESKALSMKDMGKVMKLVTERAAGRADNKAVSEMVKKKLSGL